MNHEIEKQAGFVEIRRALLPGTGLLVSIVVFSALVNLLMLVGPIFLLQIYDRVLVSRSEETLVALFILVAGLFLLMGMLDYSRGRIMLRVGVNLQSKLDSQVFASWLKSPNSKHYSPLRDLASLQKLFASPAAFALLDIPWIPLFVALIFVFHPLLGWLALGGGALLIALALVNQLLTFVPENFANQQVTASNEMADSLFDLREDLSGLGMLSAVQARWKAFQNDALLAQIKTSDISGKFGSLIRTIRLFLQSAILALGAYLVLQGEVAPSAIFACSIMMGRALAPVEQAISQWSVILRAWYGWRRLAAFLKGVSAQSESVMLPRPKANLEVRGITVIPPGGTVPTLTIDGFDLASGQALGVIGKNGSGKSSLARILTGIWTPVLGTVRLDGATLGQYKEDLGSYIGYLPQEVSLFDATVAENIARLSDAPETSLVIEAAKNAGAHEMILRLPNGYNTDILGKNCRLSTGQKQRIGLARALYGNPALLVLDEPNAHLDLDGAEELNRSIRAFKEAGNTVIIMAHRPSGIAECDLLMFLQNGHRAAFGPKDEVLQSSVRNYNEISPEYPPKAVQ